MKRIKLPAYDLWTKDRSADRPPANLRHVCSYDLNLGIDLITEAIFFRRLRAIDELWATNSIPEHLLEAVDSDVQAFVNEDPNVRSVKRSLRARRAGNPEESCKAMLDLLFRAYIAWFFWPDRFLRPGIISEAVYNGIVQAIRAEREANSREAKRHRTGIIRAARKLGLCPQPHGTDTDSWVANCPGTGHPIFFTASANQFTCPWCRRKGGPEELRTFVIERFPSRK
jgi:hypothetical protein